jgi:hypothetical protein
MPRRTRSGTDQLEVRADGDLVADREPALRQGRVPAEAVLGAVEPAGQLEGDPLLAAEPDDRPGDAPLELDAPGAALQAEIADDGGTSPRPCA